MPRKRSEYSDRYHTAFPKALRELMKENRTTQQELATYLGIRRQSVSSYCDGSSSPSWETLAKIAEYFSVSADFLLGISDDPAPKPTAVDELGLSPRAVQYLQTLHELTKIPPHDTRIFLLSYLLENRQFDLMLALCERYVRLMSLTPDLHYSTSAEYTACADTLKAHGFEISLPDDQANALFSERIVNLLRTLLDDRAEHSGN